MGYCSQAASWFWNWSNEIIEFIEYMFLILQTGLWLVITKDVMIHWSWVGLLFHLDSFQKYFHYSLLTSATFCGFIQHNAGVHIVASHLIGQSNDLSTNEILSVNLLTNVYQQGCLRGGVFFLLNIRNGFLEPFNNHTSRPHGKWWWSWLIGSSQSLISAKTTPSPTPHPHLTLPPPVY